MCRTEVVLRIRFFCCVMAQSDGKIDGDICRCAIIMLIFGIK